MAGILTSIPSPDLPTAVAIKNEWQESNDKIIIPSSIDATGATDVTEELNSFITSVPDNSEIHFSANGKYRLDGILLLSKRKNIRFEGNGAMVFAVTDGTNATKPKVGEFNHQWPRKRSQLALRGCSNITINNLKIKGGNRFAGNQPKAYNSRFEAQHGIDAEGVSGLTITNTTITDTYGDFVYAGRWSAGNASWTKNVLIKGNHFERNGRQGVALVGASDVMVEDNYIGYTRRATFDLEPDDGQTGCKNITIQNNTIGPGILLFVASGGQPANIDNVVIRGNRLKGKVLNISVLPPVGSLRTNWKIINNTSDMAHNSPLGLFFIKRVKGLEITGNSSKLSATTRGIELEEVCDYVISSNSFPGAEVHYTALNSKRKCTEVDANPPKADAGKDQVISTDNTTLSGIGKDNNGKITMQSWNQLSGPTTAKIASPGSPTTPVTGLRNGVYKFQYTVLSVIGNEGTTAFDTMIVTVDKPQDKELIAAMVVTGITIGLMGVYITKIFRRRS